MDSRPKITVITVCYNAETSIEDTISSVLAQTYPDVEYIIIDGLSNDGTVRLIEKYRDRISKFVSERDNGIYDAMNKGIDMATGDWVLFMNSGDVFYTPYVITEAVASADPNADVIFGDTLNRYRWGMVLAPGRPFTGVESRMPFCHQSTFVRRKVLADNKFDTAYRVSADHHHFYTLYLKGCRFQHIGLIVSVFDTGGVSGYSITSYKDVSRINAYPRGQYYRGLVRTYIRVGLSKILPQAMMDAYRRIKYRSSGRIFVSSEDNKDSEKQIKNS